MYVWLPSPPNLEYSLRSLFVPGPYVNLLPVLPVAFAVPFPYVLSPMSFGATWRKNFRRVGRAAQIIRRLASTILEGKNAC